MNWRKLKLALIVLTILIACGITILFFNDDNTPTETAPPNTVNELTCPETPPQNSEPQDNCISPPTTEAPTPATPDPAPSAKPNPKTQLPAPTSQPTPGEIIRGNTNKKQVIFTFDAGAGTQSLSAILTSLQKHSVKGTFFVTGKWAETNKDGLHQISGAGHEIFNHTYNHPNLSTVSDDMIVSELLQAETVIKSITGKSTQPYFRPPYGARNQHVLDVAWIKGYRSVYWTVDALDWKEDVTAAQVKDRIMSNANPGTIYLMHIGDSFTGQVLDEVFTAIKSRGYTIVSLTGGI